MVLIHCHGTYNFHHQMCSGNSHRIDPIDTDGRAQYSIVSVSNEKQTDKIYRSICAWVNNLSVDMYRKWERARRSVENGYRSNNKCTIFRVWENHKFVLAEEKLSALECTRKSTMYVCRSMLKYNWTRRIFHVVHWIFVAVVAGK